MPVLCSMIAGGLLPHACSTHAAGLVRHITAAAPTPPSVHTAPGWRVFCCLLGAQLLLRDMTAMPLQGRVFLAALPGQYDPVWNAVLGSSQCPMAGVTVCAYNAVDGRQVPTTTRAAGWAVGCPWLSWQAPPGWGLGAGGHGCGYWGHFSRLPRC